MRKNSIGGMNYANAVVAAGGLPLFMGNFDSSLAECFIDAADGLLLSGGVDVNPHHFGQSPHQDLGYVDEERDLFELELYRLAKEKAIPVFGICRGIQVINIAEGGTLFQHLPAVDNTIQHQQKNGDGSPFHEIRLEPNSILAQKYKNLKLFSNSYHHQAIDRLAESLQAIAWSSDDIIEAVVSKSGSFVFGVQWHPEASFREYPEHLIPFKIFINAVRENIQA